MKNKTNGKASLSHQRFYTLAEEIKKREDELKEKPPVFRKLADEMTEKLGYKIAPDSIRKACELFGIRANHTVKKQRNQDGDQTLEELERRVQMLEERLRSIEGAIPLRLTS